MVFSVTQCGLSVVGYPGHWSKHFQKKHICTVTWFVKGGDARMQFKAGRQKTCTRKKLVAYIKKWFQRRRPAVSTAQWDFKKRTMMILPPQTRGYDAYYYWPDSWTTNHWEVGWKVLVIAMKQ